MAVFVAACYAKKTMSQFANIDDPKNMAWFCMQLVEELDPRYSPARRLLEAKTNREAGIVVTKPEQKVATAAMLREAGSYAYQYIKPRRFLKEIEKVDPALGTDRCELHLFGKWEDTDPDVVDFILPSGEIKPLNIKPIDVIIVDKVTKTLLRFRPTKNLMEAAGEQVYKEFGSTGHAFPLLVHRAWGTFSEVKHAVNQLITLYLKQKYFEGDIRGDANHRQIAVETNKVMGGKFKHSNPVLRRIFGGKLWQRLDPDICKLALQISGHKASSLDYTIIWNNLDEVKDTMKKAPGILPVWINLIKRLVTKKHEGNALFVHSENFSPNATFHHPNIIENTKLWL